MVLLGELVSAEVVVDVAVSSGSSDPPAELSLRFSGGSSDILCR